MHQLLNEDDEALEQKSKPHYRDFYNVRKVRSDF
jgi:hypothetical protein